MKNHEEQVKSKAAFASRDVLSPERYQRLKDIGFQSQLFDLDWEANFQKLLEFQTRHNHTRVPNRYAPDPSLGTRARNQRHQLGKYARPVRCNTKVEPGGVISYDRFRRLNDIGFDWDPVQAIIDEAFKAQFSNLVVFKKRFNSTKDPPFMGKTLNRTRDGSRYDPKGYRATSIFHN